MKHELSHLIHLVDEAYEAAVVIRRDLHKHPELSEHETRTAQVVAQRLSDLGIDCLTDVAGHGVVGTIWGQDRTRAAAIRADMDALPIVEEIDSPWKSIYPGVMHACGHDIHTAVLLGTAQVLKAMDSSLPASVKLLFQPAEETVGGAKQMIDAGCMKNPDVSSVLGIHVHPAVPAGSIEMITGTMNATSTEFTVEVTGCSCHGAHPNKGIDPLLPACTIVTSLQSIVSRRIDPACAALITVGQFHSGTKNNVIPASTSFSGIIRALTMDTRDFLKEQLLGLCTSTAAAFGATSRVTFYDSYPSLENDDRLFGLVRDSLQEVLGKERVIIHANPSLGADDFSYFCHGSRGLYFNIGSGKPGDTSPADIHSGHFDPDEACIRTGILAEVAGILRVLEEGV